MLPQNFRADMTSPEIREKLEERIPSLLSSDASRVEQAEAVRDWLHSYIPVADRHSNLADLGVDHHKNPLAELLHLAESRAGGYFCGASTEIARQVYNLLGFEAHSLNFGLPPDGATHITTVVALEIEGIETWTIQDTYFNFTVRDSDDRYVDFRSILDNLVKGDVSELRIDEKESARTPALYLNYHKIPRMSRAYNLDAECIRDFPNFSEFSLKWDFELMLLLFGLRTELEEKLGTNYPLYLFAFPISTSGNDRVLALKDYADSAREKIETRYRETPSYYANTRIDDYLEPRFELIRKWPLED